MKVVQLNDYGPPDDNLTVVDVADPLLPGPGEVLLQMLATPVNPADMAFCWGRYKSRPTLPCIPGGEGVGRVIAVGYGVTEPVPGDLVLPLDEGNWTEMRLCSQTKLMNLPQGIDPLQAAMLRANPPTASLLLSDVVSLGVGDWLIQNVANSATGRLVIRLASKRGLHTVNLVRRKEIVPELEALGADVCIVGDDDLPRRVHQATGGAKIRLALDALAGEATARLSECVTDEGTVCCYGSMTGVDPVMRRSAVVFRDVRLVGFTLRRVLARYEPAEIKALYSRLARGVLDGSLVSQVEAIYSIENAVDAVRHAMRPGRSGKVLILPEPGMATTAFDKPGTVAQGRPAGCWP